VLPLLEGVLAMSLYLLEGSMTDLIKRRHALIERMASTLVRVGIPKNNELATRTLFNNGYDWENAVLLAAEARYLASQEIVGREMSDMPVRRQS
jgi:hypothetical protein